MGKGKSILSMALALVLVFAMVPKIDTRAEGEPEGETEEVSETVQVYWNASGTYWDAVETYWSAYDAYCENVDKYYDADLEHVEECYNNASSSKTAIDSAFEPLSGLYDSAEEAHNALTDEEKKDSEIADDWSYLEGSYTDGIQTSYDELEAPGSLNLQTYWLAEAAYWETSDAFFAGAEEYYGNEETGVTGILNEYNSAKDANLDEVTIQSLYTDATALREKLLEDYDALSEIYGKADSAYNELTEDDKSQIDNMDEFKEGYEGLKQSYTDVKNVGTDLENDIPDSPAPLFYDNASGKFWEAVDAYWKAADAYAGDSEQEIVGALNEYETAREAAKDIPSILNLYDKAVAAEEAVDTAYADLTDCYNSAVAKYNALSEEEKTGVEDYSDITADYEIIKTAYEDLTAPSELKVAEEDSVTVSNEEGVPEVAIKENTRELLGKIELTDKEKKDIADGNATAILMYVKTTTPSTTENGLIAGKLGDYTAGAYLDIELILKIADTSRTITNLTDKIELAVTVPDTLINKDSAKQREYCIIRIHDGVANILEDAKYADGKITFTTDCFSIYTIAYKDTSTSADTPETDTPEVTTPTNTTDTTTTTSDTTTSTDTASNTSGTTSVSSPQTGDENIFLIFLIACFGGAAVCVTVVLRQISVRRKYNR